MGEFVLCQYAMEATGSISAQQIQDVSNVLIEHLQTVATDVAQYTEEMCEKVAWRTVKIVLQKRVCRVEKFSISVHLHLEMGNEFIIWDLRAHKGLCKRASYPLMYMPRIGPAVLYKKVCLHSVQYLIGSWGRVHRIWLI